MDDATDARGKIGEIMKADSGTVIHSVPLPPYKPRIMFRSTEYRVPVAGEWFWADGDQNPSVCRMSEGMDLSYHNNGQRWILVEKP